MSLRTRSLLLTALAGILLLTACDRLPGRTKTPTPLPPTETVEPSPVPTETAVPTIEPIPLKIAPGQSIIVGGPVRTRSDPSTANPETGTLYEGATVNVVAEVKGENWLVGSQDWLSTIPDWTTDWYQLDDGSYVYAAFVFTLRADEMSPTADPGDQEKWVDVNLANQTIAAMIGDKAVFIALATTGSADFPTPAGTHYIEPDGKVASVDMTASQAGYTPAQATYDVKRVLFSLFFDRMGDAIHLNYWRPEEVYGSTPTSHGCVGLRLHDAQYFWLFGEPGMRVEIHD